MIMSPTPQDALDYFDRIWMVRTAGASERAQEIAAERYASKPTVLCNGECKLAHHCDGNRKRSCELLHGFGRVAS